MNDSRDSSKPDDSQRYEEFLRLFTRDQFRILAYIRALIHDRTASNDVFQESSLVLWRSFETFDPQAEFIPWALGVARHQVLKYWRNQKRDRHVFSEALMADLSEQAIGLATEMQPRKEALEECVQRLSVRQQELIRMFYGNNQSADSIAKVWDRSIHAVYKSLKVMRRSLLNCVEQKVVEKAES